jgi:hypothetical protein
VWDLDIDTWLVYVDEAKAMLEKQKAVNNRGR